MVTGCSLRRLLPFRLGKQIVQHLFGRETYVLDGKCCRLCKRMVGVIFEKLVVSHHGTIVLFACLEEVANEEIAGGCLAEIGIVVDDLPQAIERVS